nr:50S ribosomal protein L10 [Candidatus Sigynarchaeota archaeon]
MSKQRVISEAKLKAVDEIAGLCDKYKVIGLVKMSKIGSSKISELRSKLRGTALIRMAKKSIIQRAFEKVKG